MKITNTPNDAHNEEQHGHEGSQESVGKSLPLGLDAAGSVSYGARSAQSFDFTAHIAQLKNPFYEDFDSDPSQEYGVFDDVSYDNLLIHECFETLGASPTGRKMLHDALEQGWQIQLVDLDAQGIDFDLDEDTQSIILNNNGLSDDAILRSSYFKTITLLSMIRALREIWQMKRHGGLNTSLKPEHILLSERLYTADLDVMAVLVAWELRSEGHTQIWRHMIGSDQGDIALAFSQSLERGKLSIAHASMTTNALVGAFYQWFRGTDRVNDTDRATLLTIDEELAARTDHTDHGGQMMTQALSAGQAEVLSCLPDKTAYLVGFGREILANPLFAGLNDEINQAHLMHILYDLKVVMCEGVPFQNADLAAKIFPAS